MRRTLPLAVLLMLCGACSVMSADSDLDALLKRFVEEFVAITPGQAPFPAKQALGSDNGPASARPRYEVQLTPFAIAKYEMPQNLYEAVMGENPSRWKGPRNSVEMMTWSQAVEFCQKVTRLLRQKKLIREDEEIRLPTEAEWEYACRAGTSTDYSFGEAIRRDDDPEKKNSILDEYAWYTGNAAGNDPPVGALKPNPWGLYDMHGYLWEMTADAWTPSHQDAPANGAARPPQKDNARIVVRGGSWKDAADSLKSFSRRSFPPQPDDEATAKELDNPAARLFGLNGKDDAVGFRCVRAAVKR
jgi:formylglycine-generating enzyme required for sulfatase activity